jgi:general stress protein YciG
MEIDMTANTLNKRKEMYLSASSSNDDTNMGDNKEGNNTPNGSDTPGTSRRGFASMDQNRQRDIASQGGRAAHERGTAHEFTSEEAREAGRKGGEAVSQNRSHMAEIGRRGGEARGINHRNKQANLAQQASNDADGNQKSGDTRSNSDKAPNDTNRKP